MNELFIVGADADRAAMEGIRQAITAEGYSINVVCPNSDNEKVQKAINALNALLWITPNTDRSVLEIGTNRRNRNLSTINLFAEPIQLTSDQKSIVGRNRSIFASATQNIAVELLSLLGTPRPLTVEKAVTPNVEPQKKEAEMVDTSINNPASPAVDTMVSVAETEESAYKDSEKGIKPWTALMIMIAVFIAEYAIECAHEFYNDEIFPYIMFAVCAFIEFGCAGSVMIWQEKNGKSLFSRFAILVGSFGGIVYAWWFVKNLLNFIF